MSRLKHLTPSYIFDRMAVIANEWRHPDAPWLTADMTEFLEQWLRPDDQGLEWGSGRSTLWLARRVGRVTSVEDNREWSDVVRKKLASHGVADKVDYRFIPVASDNRTGTSPYVCATAGLAPESLDFCLVDGDLRDHCALAAIDFLRPGGLLIVDNVERYVPREPKTRSPLARGKSQGWASQEWERFSQATNGWRCFWTTNGVSDTAFWMKPFPK